MGVVAGSDAPGGDAAAAVGMLTAIAASFVFARRTRR
jgi:hypothetical protein